MSTRAEQRREKRENDRLSRLDGGIPRRLWQEAEEEMLRGMELEEVHPETVFAVLLDDWVRYNHIREKARQQYHRTAELKGRGRNVTTDPLVQQFARAKEDLELVEEQMLELLDMLGDEKRSDLLDGRHLMPDSGYSVRLPENLKARLLEQLQGEETGREAGAQNPE